MSSSTENAILALLDERDLLNLVIRDFIATVGMVKVDDDPQVTSNIHSARSRLTGAIMVLRNAIDAIKDKNEATTKST